MARNTNRKRTRSGGFRPWVPLVDRGLRAGARYAGNYMANRIGQYMGSPGVQGGRPARKLKPRTGVVKRHGRNYPKSFQIASSSKPFFTKGYAGPKFRKGRLPRGDVYKKLGSEAVLEFGSAVSDAELVGIGHHSAPLMEVWRCYWRAVWRALMKKAGIGFHSWNDGYNQFDTVAPKFKLTYTLQPELPPVVFQYTNAVPIGTYLTHYQWAQNIANDLYVSLGSIANTDNFIPLYCTISCDDATVSEQISRLELNNSYFHLSSGSTLVLQNRTLGAAATDDQTTDVTNNPVIGRSYDLTGNQLRSKAGSTATGACTADPLTGVIAGYVNTDDPISPFSFRKLNAPSALMYCKGSKRVSLSPGQIRRSSLYKTQVIRTETLMKMLLLWLTDSVVVASPPTTRVSLGISRSFQFEKLCDTRQGTQNIEIGYECNVKIKGYLTFRTAETNRMAIKLT